MGVGREKERERETLAVFSCTPRLGTKPEPGWCALKGVKPKPWPFILQDDAPTNGATLARAMEYFLCARQWYMLYLYYLIKFPEQWSPIILLSLWIRNWVLESCSWYTIQLLSGWTSLGSFPWLSFSWWWDKKMAGQGRDRPRSRGAACGAKWEWIPEA